MKDLTVEIFIPTARERLWAKAAMCDSERNVAGARSIRDITGRKNEKDRQHEAEAL
jgi:hypothetical protein